MTPAGAAKAAQRVLGSALRADESWSYEVGVAQLEAAGVGCSTTYVGKLVKCEVEARLDHLAALVRENGLSEQVLPFVRLALGLDVATPEARLAALEAEVAELRALVVGGGQ